MVGIHSAGLKFNSAVVTTSPYFGRKRMKYIVNVHFTDKFNINSFVTYKRGKLYLCYIFS